MVPVSIAPLQVPFLNPRAKLVLHANLEGSQITNGSVSVEWSLASSSPLALAPQNATQLGPFRIDDPCTHSPFISASTCVVSTTGIRSGPDFVLQPGALNGSGTYVLRVDVTGTTSDASYTNYAEVQLPIVGQPPQRGTLQVAPHANVVALATPLNLTASGWSASTAQDFPLSYAFAYQIGSGPVAFLTSYQSTTAASFSATVYLPPGNLTLLAYVVTALGAKLSVPAQSNVDVSEPNPLQVPQAVFLAVAYAQAGQWQMALQLSSTLAAFLNSRFVNEPPGVTLCQRSTLIARVMRPFLSSPSGQALLADMAGTPNSASLFSQVARTVAALVNVPVANVRSSSRRLTSQALSGPPPSPSYLDETTLAAALSAGSQMVTSTMAGANALSSACNNCSTVSAPGSLDLLYLFSNVSASISSYGALPDAMLYDVWTNASALASTVQQSILVPGEQPVQFISPWFYVQLNLDYANNASLPLGVLAGGVRFPPYKQFPCGFSHIDEATIALKCDNCSEVRTTFMCAKFDPHIALSDGNVTSATSSVLSLHFDFPECSTCVMDNLATPVPLRLEPVMPDPSRRLSAGVCAFWNESASGGTYSTDGCFGLPNPLPPGVSAFFDTSLYSLVPSDASESAKLLSALQMPDIFSQCNHTVLDCPVVGDKGVVYLNPDAPLSAPAVRCNSSNTLSYGGLSASNGPALLVLYGASCKWWKSSSGCFWNAALQSFVTSGAPGTASCVARTANASSATCLSTHLTDFSERSVVAAVLAVRQLDVTIQPLNIATKLRVALIVVFILFGLMVTAGRAFAVLDGRRRERIVASIFSDALGYSAKDGADGTGKAWTWRVYQQLPDASSPAGSSGGPAVLLAQLLGIPLARLRFAIPMELLDFDDKGDDDSSVVTSTALVFALLRTQGLLRGDEVVVQQAATSKHFKVLRSAYTGRSVALRLQKRNRETDFDVLVSLFVSMLADRSLAAATCWRDAARLWRLILLRRRERGLNAGGWDPSDGLASVLLAFHVPDDAHGGQAGAPVWWQQPFRPEQSFFTKPYLIQAEKDRLRTRFGTREPEAPDAPPVEPTWPTEPHDASHPLDFELEAITESIPDYLRDAVNIAGGDPPLAMRIWTTLLCVSLLRRLNVSWIVSGVDRGTHEKTLLDDAESWLARTATATLPMQPVRSEALLAEFNSMSIEAATTNARPFCDHLVRRWELAHEVRVAGLRAQCAAASIFMLDSAPNSDTASFAHSTHRVLAEAVSVLRRSVEVLAAVSAPATDRLGRAHRVVMLFLCALCSLTVVIGFYYFQAVHCCAEVRDALGCSTDHTQPCRGFTGDCADIRTQFADVVLPVYNVSLGESLVWPGGGVRLGDTATCTRGLIFQSRPVPGRWFSDSLIVGLVSACVVFFVRHLCSLLPRISRETPGGRWLSANWLVRAALNVTQPVVGIDEYEKAVLGSIWRFGAPLERPGWLIRFALRHRFEPMLALFRAVNRVATSLAVRFLPLLSLGPVALDVLAEKLNTDEREAFDAAFRRCTQAKVATALSSGLMGTAWIVLAWFILEYGLVIVSLLGRGSELSVLYTWLVVLFVENVLQVIAATCSVAGSLLVHYCIEPLWVMSQDGWLELYLDSGSVLSVFPAWPSAWTYAMKRMELFGAVE
jgi:hypothetical protein